MNIFISLESSGQIRHMVMLCMPVATLQHPKTSDQLILVFRYLSDLSTSMLALEASMNVSPLEVQV